MKSKNKKYKTKEQLAQRLIWFVLFEYTYWTHKTADGLSSENGPKISPLSVKLEKY